MLVFEGEELGIERARGREWVLSNGLGGYSSSTIIGMNTRKYHGLLVAADGSPAKRLLLLSKFEETLVTDGGEFALSSNEYPGVVHPKGFEHLARVEVDSENNEVRFFYSGKGWGVLKTVSSAQDANAVIVSYSAHCENSSRCVLRVTPLLNCRGIHSLAQGEPHFSVENLENGAVVYSPMPLTLEASAGRFVPKEEVYRNMVYREESARGYPDAESHFSPGHFLFSGAGQAIGTVVASASSLSLFDAAESVQRKKLALAKMMQRFYENSGNRRERFLDSMVCAADSFLVRRNGSFTILAGYHWFSDFGRDALISIPGICCSTGRYGHAMSILKRFAETCKEGRIANVFSEGTDEPQYNGADSSLWFLYSVGKFLEESAEYDGVKANLWETMQSIIEGYATGDAGAFVDDDYLLKLEIGGLTWMDAVVDGMPVTPRVGKPVEINALWYSGLRLMESLAKRYGEKKAERRYAKLAEKTGESFMKFWNQKERCLFDVIEPNDASIRPNQIFAASLAYSPLTPGKRRQIFEKVREELLTPVGLRTLSAKDIKYKPFYMGNQRERDFSYHQGTVWPWLLGPFCDAFKRCYPQRADEAVALLEPLKKRMMREKWQSIPEIFEASSLEPRGCISQAWSVAEVLRVYAENGEEKWVE